MPMEGDFMGDGDMPQPPQDNNQVKYLSYSNYFNICERALTFLFSGCGLVWHGPLDYAPVSKTSNVGLGKRYLSVICPISEKAQAKLFRGKVQLWAILVQIFLTAIVLVYECAKSLDRLSCRISLKLPKFLWNFASGVLCNMLLVISPSNYVTRGETFFEGSLGGSC